MPPPPTDASLPKAATPTCSPTPGTFTSAQPVTLATTSTGADIYYEQAAAPASPPNPTVASPVYSTTINVGVSTTIRAMAGKPGVYQNSDVAVCTYTINIPPGTTAPVTFAPAGGTYANVQTIGMSSATGGATICYTVDGSNPGCDATTAKCTGTSATYNAGTPVIIPTGGTTVKAMACKVGNTNSCDNAGTPCASATYNYTAAVPIASPGDPGATTDLPPGSNAIQLSTATTGGVIHYTQDGSTPTCGTTSPAPITDTGFVAAPLTQNGTIKALTCKNGFTQSAVQTFNYTVQLDVPKATFTSVPAGSTGGTVPNFINDEAVGFVDSVPTNTYPLGTIFCYETNAANPDPACNAAGNGCTAGVNSSTTAAALQKDATTFRFVACGPNNSQSKPTQSKTWNLKVDTIQVVTGLNPNGTVTTGDGASNTGDPKTVTFYNYTASTTDTITLKTNTVDSGGAVAASLKFRYTTNGTAPTACGTTAAAGTTEVAPSSQAGNVASVNVVLPGGTNFQTSALVVRAIACKTGYSPAAEHTVTFGNSANQVNFTVAAGPNKATIANAAAAPPGGAILDGNATGADPFNVNIANLAPGDSAVCYTTDGTDPVCNAGNNGCTTGTLYNAAVLISPGGTNTQTVFTVRACHAGLQPSPIKQFTYVLQDREPVAQPAGVPLSPNNQSFLVTGAHCDPTVQCCNQQCTVKGCTCLDNNPAYQGDVYKNNGGACQQTGGTPGNLTYSCANLSCTTGGNTSACTCDAGYTFAATLPAPPAGPQWQAGGRSNTTGGAYNGAAWNGPGWCANARGTVVNFSEVAGSTKGWGFAGNDATPGTVPAAVTYHYTVSTNGLAPAAPDCTTPTTGATYSLTQDTTWLRVLACSANHVASTTDGVTSAGDTFDFTYRVGGVAPPTFSPAGAPNGIDAGGVQRRDLPEAQNVTISTVSDSVAGTVMCYNAGSATSAAGLTNPSCTATHDACAAGTMVSPASAKGTIPVTLPAAGQLFYIKAITCGGTAGQDSAITTVGYELRPSDVVISPAPSGAQTAQNNVTLSLRGLPDCYGGAGSNACANATTNTTGASICYTLDGSLPSYNSTNCTANAGTSTTCSAAPVNFSFDETTTVKAASCKANYALGTTVTQLYQYKEYFRTIAGPAKSMTGGTIAWDGTNPEQKFDDAENKLAGSVAGYNFYLSWDSTAGGNLYLGAQGTDISVDQAGTRHTQSFYLLDPSNASTTTTVNPWAYNGTNTAPAGIGALATATNVSIVCMNGGAGAAGAQSDLIASPVNGTTNTNGAIYACDYFVWNGTTWGAARAGTFAASRDDASGNVLVTVPRATVHLNHAGVSADHLTVLARVSGQGADVAYLPKDNVSYVGGAMLNSYHVPNSFLKP